jgi:hypothetical protein
MGAADHRARFGPAVRLMEPLVIRPEDWPRRLAAYLLKVQDRPFDWGTHDCCTLAADWALELIGVDPIAPYRGLYTNAVGARRLILKHGGIEAAFTAALGSPVAPAYARRGDLVLAEYQLGPTVGICGGVDACFPGIDRLHWFPTSGSQLAWSLG